VSFPRGSDEKSKTVSLGLGLGLGPVGRLDIEGREELGSFSMSISAVGV